MSEKRVRVNTAWKDRKTGKIWAIAKVDEKTKEVQINRGLYNLKWDLESFVESFVELGEEGKTP